MTTFTSHTIDTAPEASRARLAEVQKAWGFVPKLHGNLAESPLALEAYDTLFGLVASKATLNPIEVQVAYQAINVFHECEYCTAGHTYLSRMVKMDEATIAALRNGEPIADVRLQALHLFTETVVRVRGRVSDVAVDDFLAAGFTRANVLEVVTMAATKMISNYTNHITKTEKEAFMADPALAWVSLTAQRLHDRLRKRRRRALPISIDRGIGTCHK
ncbi:MAG: carboxymuconolactone decarboxylase family protein [Rhizobium sp.]|nr:carboxymuconolactone decarboxylase family protein [Rhizobium sp.]